MWKKVGSPVSIHTCLPGMECTARPPGSETRAWRREETFALTTINQHDLGAAVALHLPVSLEV